MRSNQEASVFKAHNLNVFEISYFLGHWTAVFRLPARSAPEYSTPIPCKHFRLRARAS